MKIVLKRIFYCFLILTLFALATSCKPKKENLPYYITYELDGGYFEVEPVTVFDTNVPELVTPKRDGYEFVGWYLNDVLITSLKNNLPKENKITLVAKWNKTDASTLKVTLSNDYLHLGDELSIYVEGHFDISGLDVKYDADIINIDNWLNVTALMVGVANIEISEKANPNNKVSLSIEVLNKKPQIYAISNRVSIGQKVYFNIRNFDELAQDNMDDFLWSINDSTLCVLNEDYSISALKEGKVTLTATSKEDNRITSSIFIDIVNEDEQAVLTTNDNNYIYYTGDLIDLSILGDQQNNDFVWSSSDLEVLRVREDGKIIAVTSGVANISIYQSNNTKNRTYYEFTILENPNNDIDYIGNLLSMALSQNGYKEGPNNENKYGEWYNNNHQAWCAMFVSWCWYQTGLSNEILLKYQGCSTGQEWCIEKGIFHYKESYTPKPGDIIFFEGHTGICAYVEGDYMYTIEGNASNRVGVWRWALNNARIIGYASPEYPKFNGTVKDFSFLAGKDASGNYYWTNASGNQSTT